MRDYSTHFQAGHTPNHQYSRSRNDSDRFKKIVIGVLLVLFLFFAGRFFLSFVSGIFQKSSTSTPQVAGKSTKTQEQIIRDIKKITDSSEGTFSVFAYDITANQGFGINEQMVFTGASVNKIPILASVYHLASKGDLDLEETVVPQDDDIQDYGTGSIRYDPTGTPYSIRTLARLMMEKSDNTAAHLLGKIIIPEEKVQELVDSWGLTQTSMANNKTSNTDMQKLLVKMYRGEIASKEYTPEMLGIMTISDFDDRLPKGLPAGTKIYHKTGDEVAKIHDVGIVELSTRPYYVGIFTTDMSDEDETKRNMAKISTMVYEYFQP